jgi:hypothetical protein
MAGHLVNHVPIPKENNILQLEYVAVKSAGCCVIVQVLEAGKRLCSTNDMSKAIFDGIIFKAGENILNGTLKMLGWQPVRKVICQVFLNKVDNNTWELTTESALQLAQAGYSLQPIACETLNNEEQPMSSLGEGEYEVECIQQTRLNKHHEEGYLVKFKGYPESDNQWIPACDVIGQIPYTSTSRTGHTRYHKTKSAVDLYEPTKTSHGAIKQSAGDNTCKQIIQFHAVNVQTLSTKHINGHLDI